MNFGTPKKPMEMEMAVPIPAVDFNFDSTCSSPYMTAPSSPQRFGNFFFSAPTSPTRRCSSSSVSFQFQWEAKPGAPKRRGFDGRVDDDGDGDGSEDFEFNFSGQLERTSLSAEELFDGGKIRPLKLPPDYEQFSSTVSSPKSPKSRAIRKKDFDPFEAAIHFKEPPQHKQEHDQKNKQLQAQQRGRARTSGSSSSSSSSTCNYVRKKSRSLSPFRVSDIMFEQEESSSLQSKKTIASTTTTSNPKSYVSSILSAISFSKGNKKWKLKDLLLFRSASEGRATSKDPLTKYAPLSKKEPDNVKNASFRSTESIGSVSSSRRRPPPVSAHELHYTANRAVSEEMRRKTFLPYKQGLIGCLGFNFNPGMHEISRGIGSLTRG